MDSPPPTEPSSPPPPDLVAPSPLRHLPRWVTVLVALFEVLIVCGIPTQLVVFVAIALFSGAPILEGKQISIEVFALTSLIDTALIAILIRVFLGVSGESPDAVFLGRRPPLREAVLGLAVLPVVYLVVAGVAVGLRALWPWLHTVAENPYDTYMRTPVEATIFAVVVILAGGVREELQRGFILHRFEQHLGGAKVGLAVFTVFFGALHLTEGADAAITVGLLGLFWGVVYLRRRSVILPMVNHASFDVLQVIQALVAHHLT